MIASLLLAAALSPPVADLLRQADEAFHRRRPDEAIAKYEEAEKLDPNFDDFARLHRYGSNLNLAAPESGLQDYENGLKPFLKRIGMAEGRAWRHHPERGDILKEATRLLAGVDMDAGFSLVDEALERNPQDDAALNADCALVAFDVVDRPEHLANDAARLQRDLDRILHVRATAEDLFSAGMAAYTVVAHHPPGDDSTMIALGEAALEKAMALKKDYADAIGYHGLLLLEQANREKDLKKRVALRTKGEAEEAEARQLLHPAERIPLSPQPEATRVMELLREADEAYDLRRYDEAIAKYEEAEKLDPKFDDLQRLRRYAFLPGDEKAVSPLRTRVGLAMGRAWRHHPERGDILNDAVATLGRSGATDAALALTAEAVQRNAHDPAALAADVQAARFDAHNRPSQISADAARIAPEINRLIPLQANAEELYQAGLAAYDLVLNPAVAEAMKVSLIKSGEAALEKSIAIKSDNFEAMALHVMLLKQEAQREQDPAKRDALIAKANKEHDEALAIAKKRH